MSVGRAHLLRISAALGHEADAGFDAVQFLKSVGEPELPEACIPYQTRTVNAEGPREVNDPGFPPIWGAIEVSISGCTGQVMKERAVFVGFRAVEREVEIETGFTSPALGKVRPEI